MTSSPTLPAPSSAMRFNIDGWDTGYGSALDVDLLAESKVDVTLDIELPDDQWRPIPPPSGLRPPAAVLFIDGVRRIDARVWIDEAIGPDGVAPTSATAGICASYAAGVVCCCAGRAHVITTAVRRGLFTIARHAHDVQTRAGTYQACYTAPRDGTPLPVALSTALQHQLVEVEQATAVAARSQLLGHTPEADDLLVVDGPLRGRAHLDRAVGYIKSHLSEYLPPHLNALVGALSAGQRTPVFGVGTTWARHSWYLRLPGAPGAPWAGIVRVEATADLAPDAAVALANLTQVVLPRYASTEYKDARAPQNLYPIAGLEKDLRHKLGDQQFLYRALRTAAARV